MTTTPEQIAADTARAIETFVPRYADPEDALTTLGGLPRKPFYVTDAPEGAITLRELLEHLQSYAERGHTWEDGFDGDRPVVAVDILDEPVVICDGDGLVDMYLTEVDFGQSVVLIGTGVNDQVAQWESWGVDNYLSRPWWYRVKVWLGLAHPDND